MVFFLKKSISSDADKRIQNSSELSIIRDVDSRGNKNSELSNGGVSMRGKNELLRALSLSSLDPQKSED